MRLIFVVVVFTLVTLPLMPLQWLAVALKRPLRRRIPVFYHRFLCRLLGIRVRVTGAPVDGRPLLIVANHSSWLDISIITAQAPVVFVAKSEIARWPFFGLLAKLQRTVFVERDRRAKTGEVNATIAQRLAEGDPVLLFGEGTAGDGNRVLPFRTALIGAARDAIAAAGDGRQIWIQPLSIAYVEPAGHPARAPSAPARRLVRQDEALSAYRRHRAQRRGRCRGHLGDAGRLHGRNRPQSARPRPRRRDPRPYRSRRCAESRAVRRSPAKAAAVSICPERR